MKPMQPLLWLTVAGILSAPALARLPEPTEEAKAKAAEAAAKAAHADKVANYQLCRSREKTAVRYYQSAKAAGKETKPPVETPACVDPGPYVAAPVVTPAVAMPAAPVPAVARP